jgi:hypothetical protein
MLRHCAQDVVDAHPPWLGATHQIAHDLLGDLDGDLLVGKLVARAQAMDGAFELAPALGERSARKASTVSEMASPRVSQTGFGGPLRQDLVAKLIIHDADLGHEPAAKPRPHAHVELVELGRARSAATTTCRPPSISEFSVWQNSCWMVGLAENSMSSMSRMSILRSFSLKASASRARKACTKPT